MLQQRGENGRHGFIKEHFRFITRKKFKRLVYDLKEKPDKTTESEIQLLTMRES